MVLIEELELATLECGLENWECQETLEWVFLNQISTDRSLIKEIEANTQEGDPKGKNGTIWVPDRADLRRRVVELYHDTLITGHLGFTGTYKLVS